jgi:hypothetical protein
MKPLPITIELQDYQYSFIETMAQDMFNCPVRRRNRSYEEVYASTKKGLILEYALEKQGAIKNPAPFDKSNLYSYCWDVMLGAYKTEVKCTRDPNNCGEFKASWLTFSYDTVKTFLKNLKRDPDCVDKIIFGYYNEIKENTYDVNWLLYVDAHYFKSNIRKCNPKHPNSFDEKGNIKYLYTRKIN